MLGIFLDLETSGLNPRKHRVLEIAFQIVDLDSDEVRAHYDMIIKQPESVWEERDLESIEVNGFSWERVEEGLSEEIIREEVIAIFSALGVKRRKAVFICQNPSFDRAFFSQLIGVYQQEELQWPYHWLDLASMHWALDIQKRGKERGFSYSSIPLSKDGIAHSRKLKAEAKPHRAMNGVEHLLLCYRDIMK